MISRRAFTGLVPLALASRLLARKTLPVGVQLFSVRKQCEQDLPGTLEQIRKIGYKGVEFAGFYGRSAKEVKQLLEGNGLLCCGSHTPLDQLLGAQFDSTMEFHQTLGNKTLIVPGLPPRYAASRQVWRETASLFDDLSVKLQKAEMRIGYHNHAMEFQALDGEKPWDTFFGHTSPEIIMQLDLGNARLGGADPLALLQRYPGRAKSIHVKDYLPGNADALIGESAFDWPQLFQLCETLGGTEWYIVEHESTDRPGVEGIEDSFRRFHLVREKAARTAQKSL
jgi:sugar phosphate isomerase/epimerase